MTSLFAEVTPGEVDRYGSFLEDYYGLVESRFEFAVRSASAQFPEGPTERQ